MTTTIEFPRTRYPSRILVVDDDADAGWALGALLKQQQVADVRVVADGAHAVDAASEMRPEVILMDIRMPGIDGMEAAQVLRGLFPAARMPRLIAVTGLDATRHEARILAAGFDACLSKPLSLEALQAALRVVPAQR